MKGQSPIVSHTIIIGITVFIIIVMLLTLNYLRNEYQKFEGENDINNICLILKNSIEKIYHPENIDNYQTNVSSVMGKIIINLPAKISDIKYNINFVNSSIQVKGLLLNQTCKLWFNITYTGFSSGGLTELSWIRLGRNDTIEMRNV